MDNKKLKKESLVFKVLVVVSALVVLLLVPELSAEEKLKLDERPAVGGEWGYRPSEGTVSAVNPPSFSWRPQKGLTWEVTCTGNQPFRNLGSYWKDIEFNVYCTDQTFPAESPVWPAQIATTTLCKIFSYRFCLAPAGFSPGKKVSVFSSVFDYFK